MKAKLYLGCLLIFLAANVYSATDKLIQVIYVSDVKMNGANEDWSAVLTNQIREEFAKSSRHKLANPASNEALDKAKNYNESCLSVEECARKEAKAVDADEVLISDVTKIEGLCRITMRLENIYTKEIIKSKNMKASCSLDDLEEKTVDLVYLIMKKEGVLGGEREALFTSNPSGAKVAINNIKLGYTPLKTMVPLGRARIWMEIEGNARYAPVIINELIEISPLPFKSHKDFAEREAYLLVNVSPSETKITIGEKTYEAYQIKKIPIKIREPIEVILEANEYKTRKVSVPSLDPDEEHTLNVSLVPQPCKVIITSSPNGADVILNSKKAGTTPFDEELEANTSYQLIVKQDLYRSHSDSFDCSPAESVTRDVSLTAATMGTLEVKAVNKVGHSIRASIYVNDRRIGKSTPNDVELEADKKHLISLSHSLYDDVDFKITMDGGEVVEKEKTMTFSHESYWRAGIKFGYESFTLDDVYWVHKVNSSTGQAGEDADPGGNFAIGLNVEREIFDFIAIRISGNGLFASADEKSANSTIGNYGQPNTPQNGAKKLNAMQMGVGVPIYFSKIEPLENRHYGYYLMPELGKLNGRLEFESGYKYNFTQNYKGLLLGADWAYNSNWDSAISVFNVETGYRQFSDVVKEEFSGDREFLPRKGQGNFHISISWGKFF